MKTRHLVPVLLALVAVALACFVPEPELEARACDPAHPCQPGFECLASQCVSAAPVGLDASSGACTPGVPLCRAGDWYACPAGVALLQGACSDAGFDCEGWRGCLAPCGAGCPAGTACDLSSQRCVSQPACAAPEDCEDWPLADCLAGACVADSTEALVTLSDDAGLRSAELGCYGGDAGVPTTGLVTMSGYVLTPVGKMTGQTIGMSLKVYVASEFNEQENPSAVAWGTSHDSGGMGAFTLTNVPVDVDLVAETSGAGAVRTFQYFNLRPDDVHAGVADQSVTSFDQALWDQLVSGAGVAVRQGRGGVVGQVFDCHPSPAKVSGATAALDTPGRAFYTFEGLVGIDVDATATTDTGRFFFFDVPAFPLTLVADLAGTIVSRRVRVRPDSVSLVLIRP